MPKRREQKHLSEDELEGLKKACRTFKDQLIVYGLAYSGMRVDELCHLHKGWINLREGTITIPKEENGWHPKIVKVVDKQSKKVIKEYCSNRIIPVLNDTLLLILAALVKYNYRLDMSPKDVWVRLNQLWTSTGYPGKISPHMLRHTCLTMMEEFNLRILSPILNPGDPAGILLLLFESQKIYSTHAFYALNP